jgi:uncharacterized spore protein YtfJ
MSSVLEQSAELMTARRVFGEPIEKNGLVVVPVATVSGGAGGSREDGGYGLHARPAGVFVIRGDSVEWRPAVNVNMIILGGQLVGIVALIALRSIVKTLARRRR